MRCATALCIYIDGWFLYAKLIATLADAGVELRVRWPLLLMVDFVSTIDMMEEKYLVNTG